jgi:acid phosphatase family membrane protein YuiD
MAGLLPGALIGGFIGFFLGAIVTRRTHLSSSFATAGKNHSAAVKALAAARKAKRGVVGTFALTVLFAIGALVLLGYVSLKG